MNVRGSTHGPGSRRVPVVAIGLALAVLASHSRADAERRWFGAHRPGPQAGEAIALLAESVTEGLEPADYALRELRAGFAEATRAGRSEASETMWLDDALTRAMRSYLRDLHDGRVDPRNLHQDFAPPHRPGFDAAAYLDSALAAGRLREAAAEAAPAIAQYARLREMLARYRALADHRAWRRPLPPLPSAGVRGAGRLEPGAAWPGVATLAERLAALGDLPAEAAPPAPAERAPTRPPGAPAPLDAAPRYSGAIVDAVRRFQHRHGLEVDGVVGRETLARLEVTPRARARQIALAMERLRWTPLLQAPRMIVVNVPEFVLRAYEVRDGRVEVRARMKVVVGKALDTRTPLIEAQMRYIEFSPYWNVPASIASRELVPLLRRRPERFAREGYEFVAGDGRVDTVLTPGKLDAVLAERLRIRQRPGPTNPLGDIKFAFPNRESIFLHHTPATGLFARARRDFSHGCIRVEEPVALARFVLAPQPGWTPERIGAAMASGVSTTLPLVAPLPVLIAYATAIVKEGGIFFYDDLYGHDRALDAALRARSPPRPHVGPLRQPTAQPAAPTPNPESTR